MYSVQILLHHMRFRKIANLIFIATGNFVGNVRAQEKETDADARPLNDGLLLFSARHIFFLRRRYYVVAFNDERAARSVGTRQLSLLTLNWSKLLQLDVITRRRRGTSAMFLSFSFSFSLCRKYHQRDVTILKLSSCQPLSISYF